MAEDLELVKCANGVIVRPGRAIERDGYYTSREAFYVFNKPADLAEHIRQWAEANGSD